MKKTEVKVKCQGAGLSHSQCLTWAQNVIHCLKCFTVLSLIIKQNIEYTKVQGGKQSIF